MAGLRLFGWGVLVLQEVGGGVDVCSQDETLHSDWVLIVVHFLEPDIVRLFQSCFTPQAHKMIAHQLSQSTPSTPKIDACMLYPNNTIRGVLCNLLFVFQLQAKHTQEPTQWFKSFYIINSWQGGPEAKKKPHDTQNIPMIIPKRTQPQAPPSILGKITYTNHDAHKECISS